jgi:hypothetical protein
LDGKAQKWPRSYDLNHDEADLLDGSSRESWMSNGKLGVQILEKKWTKVDQSL